MRVDARLFAAALTVLAACAPIRRFEPRALSPRPAEIDARSRAAAMASADFRRAWTAGDTAALAKLVSPDFTLVLQGDSLRGAAASGYLASLASSQRQELAPAAGKLEVCLGGNVLEFNSEVFGLPVEDAVTSGRYAIAWSGAEGSPRAERMDFRYGSRSIRGSAECESEAKHAALRHRLAFTIATGARDLGSATGADMAASALHREGYTFSIPESFPQELYGYGFAYRPSPPKTGPGSRPFPQIGAGGIAVTLGVRYLVDETKGLELQVASHAGETATGFHNTCFDALPCDNRYFARHRFVEVSSAPVSVSLLAQKRVGWFRLGAGPAFVMSNWATHDDERNLHYVAGGSSAWQPANREDMHDTRSLSPAFGFKAELAVLYPLTRYVVFEARASRIVAGKSEVPSTPFFAGTTATSRLQSIGGGLSISWK
jgi:hypothetical protein